MNRPDPKAIAKEIVKGPIALDVIEAEIRKIAAAMRAIDGSALKRRAIILLLQDVTKLPRNHIEYVLNAMSVLDREFLKTK